MIKPQAPNPKSQIGSLFIVHCSLFIAFALRLYRLGAQSLWWDEAITLHLATSTVADLLADRAAHVHPPLYFLLLKGWVALAGPSGFSVRFFSVWFNTLLVAAVYNFGRRYLDRHTGLIAAFLTAISPLYVIYSQEARVYALLPLVYLAILSLVHRLTRAPHSSPFAIRHSPFAIRDSQFDWLLLIGIEVVGLHLHYVVMLAVAYANVLLMLRLWRCPEPVAGRRRRELTRWLVSLALVALLCLPWANAVFISREAVLADVGAGDPFVEPVPLDFFARLLWTFQWSGLTAAPGYPPLHITTLLLASLLLIALILLLANARTRTTALRLLTHWLAPLAPAILMWRAKPASHPRYVALFAVALLLLAGYALAQLGRRRVVGRALAILLGLALIAPSPIALHAWYCDPRFAKDDVRGLATWLEAKTTAADLIVAPWQDWSLDYAYHGPATIIRPNPADEAATWETLVTQAATAKRVFLVDYPRDNRDRRGLVPFALESAGNLIERHSFKGLLVRLYELDFSPSSPPLGGIEGGMGGHFAPLRLTAAWVEQNPPSDTAVTVALRWRLDEPVADRYRLSLRLRDLDGWELSAGDDDWLLNDGTLPTDRWTIGEQATTYHVLPLVPGTPPLTYTLSIGVYTTDDEENIRPLDLLDVMGNPQGQSYDVGSVTLSPARGLRNDPYGVTPDLPPLPEPAALADNLLLEAAALDRQAVAPGQSLFVTLRWRSKGAVAAPLPDLRPALTLSQAGSTLVTVEHAPAGGRYTTDRWQADEVVLEHRSLTIPPTAADGPASVTIELGDRRVVLGSVEIIAGEHLFAPPPLAHEVHVRFGDVAELLGYDLPPPPFPPIGGKGEGGREKVIPITLYWRALEGAASADYTVFTHILAADGHLVALHDSPPASGTRPTPGWLPGEIITDHHEMAFREAYTGPAVIEVGLYDSATLERVVAATGETFVILPSPLNVEGQW